jgi:hypothetical protein
MNEYKDQNILRSSKVWYLKNPESDDSARFPFKRIKVWEFDESGFHCLLHYSVIFPFQRI